jgi:antitoxin component YwqK of YwqJK toxin-antitoxin module
MMGAKASGLDPYPKGLEYPLDYLGSPDGLIEDLEYDRAYLIDHFDREGVNFVELFQYLVKHKDMNEPVFDPLRDYFMYNQTYNSDNFYELYRDYAAFFCLSTKSPISSHDPYDKVANKKDVYQQNRTKKIEADFDLEGGYTSKIWAVKIQGTKKEKGCQKDDYPIGRWNTWHENGNKLSEGSYNDNHERDGLWEFWYEDGIPHSSINYLEGLPHGNGVWYYDNGRKEMQGKLDAGEKTGKWQEWYENGKKKFEGVYKKGKLHGPFKSYSETGKLSQTGNYTNGEPSGVWNYYMDNGVRYKTLDYNNAVTIWYKKDGEEVDRVDNW